MISNYIYNIIYKDTFVMVKTTFTSGHTIANKWNPSGHTSIIVTIRCGKMSDVEYGKYISWCKGEDIVRIYAMIYLYIYTLLMFQCQKKNCFTYTCLSDVSQTTFTEPKKTNDKLLADTWICNQRGPQEILIELYTWLVYTWENSWYPFFFSKARILRKWASA